MWALILQIVLLGTAASQDAFPNETLSEDKNELSASFFTDLVKRSLSEGDAVDVFPEDVQCRDVDRDSRLLWWMDGQRKGVPICAVCPNWYPFKRYSSILLDADPLSELPLTSTADLHLAECLSRCQTTKQCLAFTIDVVEAICYLYNSTSDAVFRREDGFVTVVVEQPEGQIADWVYARHSKLFPVSDSTESTVTRAETFPDCLSSCSEAGIERCQAANFDLRDETCTLFHTGFPNLDNKQEPLRFEREYGSVAMLNQEYLHRNDEDESWRFVEEEEDESETNLGNGITNHDEKCAASEFDDRYGNFFNPACLQSDLLGCDKLGKTGCQRCYYPEKLKDFSSILPICHNSALKLRERFEEARKSCSDECLKDDFCVRFGVKQDSLECVTVRDTPEKRQGWTYFTLIYPRWNGSLYHFDWIFNAEIVGRTRTATDVSQKECLDACNEREGCQKVAFSGDGTCLVSGAGSGLKSVEENKDGKVLYVKKPLPGSNASKFVITQGLAIKAGSGNFLETTTVPPDWLDGSCLEACHVDNECQYVSIRKQESEAVCTFYGKETPGRENVIQTDPMSDVYIRSLASLDLDDLDRIGLFQGSDMHKCFRGQSSNATLTQSDLSALTSDGETRGRRRVRRFWDDFVDGLSSVGEFVVDGVGDAVGEVIDTVEGAAKVAGKLAQGDLEGALEAARSIPFVEQVEATARSAIKLGEGVLTGDLDKIKEGALGAIVNFPVDKLLPGAGKVAKAGLKKIGDKVKKLKKRAKKRKKRSAFNKNKTKKKDNKDKRKKRDKKCKKRRSKRATARGKRARPSDCQEEDDEKKGRCGRPDIAWVEKHSIKKCVSVRAGKTCSFDCQDGYKESPTDKARCVQDPKNKKRGYYSPKPKCVEDEECAKGINPIIPVHVKAPHKITMYAVRFDKSRKLPFWSAAYHDDFNDPRPYKRKDRFSQHKCKALDRYQATHEDYTWTGWQRGHLTPAKLLRFVPAAPKKANLLINVAPQDKYTNEVPWKKLENHVGCFMSRNSGFVFTGTCRKSQRGIDIKRNIPVPECFWKLICYRREGRTFAMGFVGDNTELKALSVAKKKERRLSVYKPVSVQQLITKEPSLLLARDPRLKLTQTLVQGRPSALTTGLTVAQCLAGAPFDAREAGLWQQKLSQEKKKKRKREKRDAELDEIGCTPEEMERFGLDLDLESLEAEFEKAEEEGEDDDANEDAAETDGFGDIRSQECGKRIIGYYPSWGKRKFTARMAERLTHVVYAFLEMTADGTVRVGSVDGNDADPAAAAETSFQRLEQMIDVASNFPHLRVMFAVGGWENSQYFSSVVRDAQKRVYFISSLLKIVDTFGFDGVDLDWEYPVTGGAQEGIPQDKENYVKLFKELRASLDALQGQVGREEKYLISFAGAAGEWTLTPGYDLPEILKYADWANIMSYDYFGPWESKWGAFTGPPAPLHFAMPPRFSGKTNTDFTVKYYVCRSEKPHQINMGVPFYGRYWNNVGDAVDPDPKYHMWRKAEAVNGKFEGGFLAYRDIQAKYVGNEGNRRFFNDVAKTPYLYNPATKFYLGYEDAESIRYKVEYAEKYNLGGLMIWAIDQDDFDYSMLDVVASADLCKITDSSRILHKCSPLKEKRWWTYDDDVKKAGMCGRSAPLFKGFYPLCDPDDPGYSCCSPAGYCGTGAEFCSCEGCRDYATTPDLLLEEPVRPTLKEPRPYYLMDAADGRRGRCGRDIDKIHGEYPICNPDDTVAHCCSNGGYCGATAAHCQCDGCVDFKRDPGHRFKEKTWWTWADGADKAGRCGPGAPKLQNGKNPICDPDSKEAYCCSSGGYCGNTPGHCSCSGCVDFRKDPGAEFEEVKKRWWTWQDGADKAGRCGASAPRLPDGSEPICDPNSQGFHCCSASGYCGGSPDHCTCSGCRDHSKDK